MSRRSRIPPPPGLCARCRHVRLLESDRGSRFVLCRLAAIDPRFPRYPQLPVRQCTGFEEKRGGGVPIDEDDAPTDG